MFNRVYKLLQPYLLYLAWFQSLVAMLGSLFFSEVLKWPPCVLCWYQRICMYALVPILTVGIVRRDPAVKWYALPLALTGFVIALYHELLYHQILPQLPCVQGVSCTTKYFELFGFVTIPLMSLAAFSIILFILFTFRFPPKKPNSL